MLTQQIDVELSTARTQLAAAQDAQRAAAALVVEQPGERAAHDAADATDAEVVRLGGVIARLTAAREHAKVRDEVEVKQARARAVQQALQAAITHAQSRTAIAEEIRRGLLIVSKALGDWDTATQKTRHETHTVLAHAGVTNDVMANTLHEATAPYCAAPFVRLLSGAGIGTSGLHCADHFTLPFVEDQTPLESAAHLAATRLLSRLKPIADKAVKELSK